MYRVAFAPTRDLSLSDLRVALVNFICAKQANKPLIVRIEDGDKAHTIEGKDQEMLDTLALFDLPYATLYYQSDNFKYHLQFASMLLDRKKAFICFCQKDTFPYDGTCENLSSEAILNTPKPFVIRMKRAEHIDDSFIMMRTDKYPTRLFASACDDMLQGVSAIIQEQTYLSDASKEAYIRTSIGYDEAIAYTHLPSLHCQSNEMSVKKLLDQGFMPEAIVNYLLCLTSPTPTAIFTLNEAIAWFDINTIFSIPVPFEMEKLQAINREHIIGLEDMELSKRIGYACENVGKLAKLYTKKACTTHEIKQKVDAMFAKKEPLGEEIHESLLLQKLILGAPYCEVFDDFKTHLLRVSGLDEKRLLTLLRFWLGGSCDTIELALLYPLIKTYLKEIVR